MTVHARSTIRDKTHERSRDVCRHDCRIGRQKKRHGYAHRKIRILHAIFYPIRSCNGYRSYNREKKHGTGVPAEKNRIFCANLTDGSTEGSGDSRRRTARHEISLLPVVPEVLELGEGGIEAQHVGFALGGVDNAIGE